MSEMPSPISSAPELVVDKGVIYVRIESVRPDRVNFKPYSPDLVPVTPLWVEIPLEGIEHRVEGNRVVLTLDGYAALLDRIASVIYKMHTKWTHSVTQ